MRVGLESPSYSRRRSHPQRSGPQDQSTPSLNALRSPPPAPAARTAPRVGLESPSCLRRREDRTPVGLENPSYLRRRSPQRAAPAVTDPLHP